MGVNPFFWLLLLSVVVAASFPQSFPSISTNFRPERPNFDSERPSLCAADISVPDTDVSVRDRDVSGRQRCLWQVDQSGSVRGPSGGKPRSLAKDLWGT